MIHKYLGLFAIVALFAFSVAYVHAGSGFENFCQKYPLHEECQDVRDGNFVIVKLPLERTAANTFCYMSEPQTYICQWHWNLEQWIKDTVPEVPPVGDETAQYELWLEEFLPLIEANKKVHTPQGSETEGFGELIDPEAEQSATDDRILDDFEECFGGQEQAGAFQAKYSIKKFEAIIKRFLTGDDKLAQECIAILKIKNFSNTAYPGMVINENTEPKTIKPELKMSAGTQVTPEKLKEQANVKLPDHYPDPYGTCKPRANDNLDRCANRGNSEPIISERVDLFIGKSAKSIYQKYLEKQAADILTAQDIKNLNAELNRLVCETAWKTSGYGGLSVNKWRTFLSDGWCDDKLDADFMKRTTLGKYESLEEAREHRIAIDKRIEAGRQ
jgi:hypothetical protein